IRTAPQCPVILALRFLDGQIVDGSKPRAHQPVLIEFPNLIAIRAEPIPVVIVAIHRQIARRYSFLRTPKPLRSVDSRSFVHLRLRNATISCLPFTNSERFLRRESTV